MKNSDRLPSGPGVKRLEFFRILAGIHFGIATSLPAVAPRNDSVVRLVAAGFILGLLRRLPPPRKDSVVSLEFSAAVIATKEGSFTSQESILGLPRRSLRSLPAKTAL